jgi:hypothetical protein
MRRATVAPYRITTASHPGPSRAFLTPRFPAAARNFCSCLGTGGTGTLLGLLPPYDFVKKTFPRLNAKDIVADIEFSDLIFIRVIYLKGSHAVSLSFFPVFD